MSIQENSAHRYCSRFSPLLPEPAYLRKKESLTVEVCRLFWVCRFFAPVLIGRKRISSALANLQHFLPDSVHSRPLSPCLLPSPCSYTVDGATLSDCSCLHSASPSVSADACRTAPIFPFLHFPLVVGLQCPKCFIKETERNVFPFAPPAFTGFITTMRTSDFS